MNFCLSIGGNPVFDLGVGNAKMPYPNAFSAAWACARRARHSTNRF